MLRRATFLAVALCALVTLVYAFAHPPPVGRGALDFNAFYCAADVLSLGHDPYRYEPLHSCETRNMRAATPNAVVPAPLPPYAIAAFIPLARVPFPQASLAWWLLSLASTVVVIWAVVELTSLPLLLVGACIAGNLLLQCAANGALAPIPIAALCAAAVAILRRRYTIAAILLGVSCIEPHVALPPLLAVFVLVPAMRIRLAVLAGALFAASLAASPVLGVEYLGSVLPAHAASELGTEGQYGLTAMLHAAGLSDHVSLEIGSLQYVLFAIAGLWLARSLRRDVRGAVILAPMACAVTGGTFVHATQIAGALPFALAIAAQADGPAAWIGTGVLAIPWQFAVEDASAPFAGIVLAVVLLYRRVHWAAAVVSGILLALVLWRLSAAAPVSAIAAIPAIRPSALAEVAWRALASQYPPNAVSWIGHGLTYFGLACVYWTAIMRARVVRSQSQTVAAHA